MFCIMDDIAVCSLQELFRRRKSSIVLLALALTGIVLLLYHTHSKIVVEAEAEEQREYLAIINQLNRNQQKSLKMRLLEKSIKKPEIVVVQDRTPQETVSAPAPSVAAQNSRYVHSSMKLGLALKTQHTSNQTAIVEAIKHAWSAYTKYAWGADEVKPVSMTSFTPSYGLGMTLIDCLDTLWLVGLQDEFDEAREWVANSLDIEGNTKRVSLFETNIRVLGGLLGAYHLSLDNLFLDKAVSIKIIHCKILFIQPLV